MKLAVIGTFYRRPDIVPVIAECIRAQTRKPDSLWLLWEERSDAEALYAADWGMEVRVLPFGIFIPRDVGGRPLVVPPSAAINVALDLTDADCIAYLTDDSFPAPTKYERMVEALADHGAVYCSQRYGYAGSWHGTRNADREQGSPFCVVDHTQVAHRRSDDRWPTDLQWMPYSDGEFFRRLVARFGPLYPIPEVLDETMQQPDGISRR
jgi:hypothetical protein